MACEAEDMKRDKHANLAPPFASRPSLWKLSALLVLVQSIFFTSRASHHGVDRRASCNGVAYLLHRHGNAASVLDTVGFESADSQKLDAVFYL